MSSHKNKKNWYIPQNRQILKKIWWSRFLVIPPPALYHISNKLFTHCTFFLVVCIWRAECCSESVSRFWDIRMWTSCLCTADVAWGRWYLEMHCRTLCVTLHTELCMLLQCYILLCAISSRKSLSLGKLCRNCSLCPFRDFYSTVLTLLQIRCMCKMQYKLDCDGFNSSRSLYFFHLIFMKWFLMEDKL